jgi:hypothetical protein
MFYLHFLISIIEGIRCTYSTRSLISTGAVEGDLVYVNYGRIEDLAELEQLGVSLTGESANSWGSASQVSRQTAGGQPHR